MFFYASKVAWFFATPSNLLAITALLGAALLWRGRRGAGLALAATGFVGLFACGLGPVGTWLIVPLEYRFGPPAADAPAPAVIVVLGGGVEDRLSAPAGRLIEVNEAGDRLLALLALALRFPDSRIVYSGGSGELVGASAVPEAQIVRHRIDMLGLSPGRILFEDRSRTTAENAREVAGLLPQAPGETWWLVTSAFHMPRAVGSFRAQGRAVTAYPVDYRTAGPGETRAFLSLSEGLRRTDLAAKEWMGLLAYRLSGRSSALFPAP